jgi:hypothetical protein
MDSVRTKVFNGKETLRAIVGPEVPLYTLTEFLAHFLPTQPAVTSNCSASHDDRQRLERMLLIPSSSLKPLTKTADGRLQEQSLASLVDDVVWALVQRRERRKQVPRGANNAASQFEAQQARNLLCQGYIIGSSDDSHSSTTSHFAMIMTHLNSNVDYCKTSSLMHTLHRLYGDESLRTMLMHTSIFLPVEQDWDHPKGNFMQLAGPPLSSVSSVRSRKRKLPEHLQTQTILPRKQRRSLFYSNAYVPNVGLSQNHVLNATNQLEPQKLLRSIFHDILGSTETNSPEKESSHARWKEILRKRLSSSPSTLPYSKAYAICITILKNHRSADYHRSLERHCPLPPEMNDQQEDKDLLARLSVRGHSSHTQVTAWVRSIISRVFSREIWGGTHNEKRIFEHLIPKYISLRREEHFSNKTLLQEMRVTKFHWLIDWASFGKQNKLSHGDHERCRLLVLSFLRWLFSDFVVALLRSAFFVTESEFSGKQVLYYRKPVWARFRNLSLHKLIQQQHQYQELSQAEARGRLTQLGVSALRLLPKATGVRPIATLCKQEALALENLEENNVRCVNEMDRDNVAGAGNNKNGPTSNRSRPSMDRKQQKASRGYWSSTNAVLNDAFAVLKYEHSRNEESFGVGMQGLHYFYPRYRKFLEKLKPGRSKQLYFGSVDIRHCYDNIDQEHLIHVVEGLLKEEVYLLQRYKVLHPSPSMGRERILSKQKKEVRPLEEFDPFHRTVSGLAAESHRCVFVDGVSCATTKKEHIMQHLRDHLTNHLVVTRGRYGNRFLVQTTGIPQGSVLSSLLCNFYYGSIEKRLFALEAKLPNHEEVEDATSCLLVRMVDDFLLVSVTPDRVDNFLAIMNEGDPRLGVEINKEKTKVSSNMNNQSKTCENLEPARTQAEDATSDFFPWCGMLFHCCTGEVRVDYSRLLENGSATALTVERATREGEHLSVQMKGFVRPRCIPILFDSVINTRETQIVNFYQLMVLAAVKTVVYLRSSDMMASLQSNVPFFLRSIESTSIYAFNLVGQRLKAGGFQSKSSLRRQVALQLGWHAFRDVCRYVDSFKFLADKVEPKLSDYGKNFGKLHATMSTLLSCFFAR